MYIRFVIDRLDEDSQQRQGIFQAVYDLRDSGNLPGYQMAALGRLSEWFDKNLEKPLRLRRSRKVHAQDKAISWFRPEAAEHIAKMREMAAILEEHGIPVEVVKTDKPGFIVYEGRYQVVAEPFRETGT